jgi:hypothetical protein
VATGTVSEVKLETDVQNPINQETTYCDSNNVTGTDGLVLSDWTGKLVTISDKKWSVSGTTKAGKSGDSKYDLKLWYNSANNNASGDALDDGFKVFDISAAQGLDISKNDTRINLGNGNSYRVNSSTVYVFVEKRANDIDVSVYTGGVSYKKDIDNGSYVIVDKDSSTTAKYVVILTGDADQAAYSDDLIYIKDDSGSEGDGFYSHEVYLKDGTKTNLDIADSQYSNKKLTAGFYTYEQNSKGFYEIDSNVAQLSTGDWKVGNEGVVANAFITSVDDLDLDSNLLTVSNANGTYYDIKITSSVGFVDIRSDRVYGQATTVTGLTGTERDGEVKTLKRLSSLLDDGYTAQVQVNVSTDGVVTILLTGIAK